jgi:hypothetical protein
MVGARGVVLGVLVLLRIHAQKLAPIAVIAFGTAASDVVLILVALLALGGTLVLTGSTLSGTVLSLMMMRPSTQT